MGDPGSPKRCLMIGAGGMAGSWIRGILPDFRDRLEIVGLVDVSETALADSGDFLGLDPERRAVGRLLQRLRREMRVAHAG